MKHFLRLLFILFILLLPYVARTTNLKDSLAVELAHSADINKRLQLLMTLSDLSYDEEKLNYSIQLYNESLAAKRQDYMLDALDPILRYYSRKDDCDSTYYYMQQIKKNIKTSEGDYLYCYFETMKDSRAIYYKKGEEKLRMAEKYHLLKDKELKGQLSLPQRVGLYYFEGIEAASSINDRNSIEKRKKVSMKNKEIVAALKDVPLKDCCRFLQNAYSMISSYEDDENERTKYILQFKDMEEEYGRLMRREGRYHYSKKFLVVAYGELATLITPLGEKQTTEYFHKFLDLNSKYGNDAILSPVYQRYRISWLYYIQRGNHKKVVECCDTLINYFYKGDKIVEWDSMLELMKEKIDNLDSLHLYKEAFLTQKEYIHLLDSVRINNMNSQLEDMDINKHIKELTVQKSELEVTLQKSKNMRFLFGALFFFAFSLGSFVYFRLWKTKKLYKKLENANRLIREASKKARENDDFKKTFIRNICHEVRTPLNAINGFSELIADGDITPEEKKQFSKIIFDNCRNITIMMNDILGISSLDTLNSNIELTSTHIHNICKNKLDEAASLSYKPAVEYMLQGDPCDDVALTNKADLELILSRLLNNAGKFTQEGSVVLSYAVNREENKMYVSVIDTGCGIPKEKSEWIFEEFSKGDSFVPGSGLGLYFCKLIAKHMRASLFLDTSYEGGCRFLLVLPLE